MLCLRCPPGSFEIKNLGRQGGYIVEFFFRAATTCCKCFPKKKLFSDDVNFKITNYASYYCLELNMADPHSFLKTRQNLLLTDRPTHFLPSVHANATYF